MGGALEPMHTVAVHLDDRGGDLATLKEARIARMRSSLAENLEALEAAGVALRWARHLFPPRTPEPEGFRVLVDLLDALDAPAGGSAPVQALAHAGLSMLAAVGYALDLERCVVCGRPCPAGRPACVDPARGGLVCRSCGGAATVLVPGEREAARSLLCGGHSGAARIDVETARTVLGLVDRAMAAHAGFER